MVSNNGGNIISNNGGNIVANNSGRYRLQQNNPLEIPLTPVGGESLQIDRRYPDGSRFLVFEAGNNTRSVVVSAADVPTDVVEFQVTARHASGTTATQNRHQRTFSGGVLSYESKTRETRNPDGSFANLVVELISAVAPTTNWRIEIRDALFDFTNKIARYQVLFPNLGVLEESINVQIDSTDDLPNFDEPLLSLTGEAVVKTIEGVELFRKRSDDLGLWYELKNGIRIFVRDRLAFPCVGDLIVNGSVRGIVTIDRYGAAKGSLGITARIDGQDFTAIVESGQVRFVNTDVETVETPSASSVIENVPSISHDQTGPWFATTLLPLPTARLVAGSVAAPFAAVLDSAGPNILISDTALTPLATIGLDAPQYSFGQMYRFDIGKPLTILLDPENDRILVAEINGIKALTGISSLGIVGPGFNIQNTALELRLEQVAGTSETGHQDGPAQQARFQLPSALRRDIAGNLYILDSGNHCLRRMTPAGNVETLAGRPGVAGQADGVGTEALFADPIAMAILPTGDLIVADAGNQRLCRVTPGGLVTTLAGGKDRPILDEGDVGFGIITTVEVDAQGQLYVGEAVNVLSSGEVTKGAVRRVAADGRSAVTLGGGLNFGTSDNVSNWAGISGVFGLWPEPKNGYVLMVQDKGFRLLAPFSWFLGGTPSGN